MPSLNIKIKTKATDKKILVELDADKFERLAANFGFFSNDFLKSVEQGEKDYTAGRIKKIRSLKDLRAK